MEKRFGQHVRQAAVRACRRVLIPVAKVMMEFGVDFKSFSDAAKLAFVDGAIATLRESGAAVSKSNVAEFTGLSRREVSKILTDMVDGDDPRDLRLPTSEVMNEWMSNPKYIDNNGKPAVLSLDKNKNPSLYELAAGFGLDGRLDELVAELESSGAAVIESGDTIRKVKDVFIADSASVSALYHFERTMYTLGCTILNNITATDDVTPLFERSAYTYGLRPLALPKFIHLTETAGQSYLTLIDEWLTANEDKSEKVRGDVVSGVCVFAFHHKDSPFTQRNELVEAGVSDILDDA